MFFKTAGFIVIIFALFNLTNAPSLDANYLIQFFLSNMKNTLIIVAIVGSLLIIILAISGGNKDNSRENSDTSKTINISADSKETVPASNVYMEGNKQIVEINVKGGYSPRQSNAKSGIPTILRFKTNKTFDCSSSISIPSLKISEYLQDTGVKDFDIGIPVAQKLKGNCSMGMYQFVKL